MKQIPKVLPGQVQITSADKIDLQAVEMDVPGSVIPEARGMLVLARGNGGVGHAMTARELVLFATNMLNLAIAVDQRNADNAAKVAQAQVPLIEEAK